MPASTKPKKSTSKKTTRAKQPVRLQVEKTDRLNQYVSPHVLDLSHLKPEPEPQLLPQEQVLSVEEIIAQAAVEPAPRPVQETAAPAVDEQRRAELLALQQELVAEMDPYTPPAPRPVAPPPAKASRSITAANPVRFQIKKISWNPFLFTKNVFISFGQSVDTVTQPLKQSLSPRLRGAIVFMVATLIIMLPIGGAHYYAKLRQAESNVLQLASAAVDDLKTAGEAAGQQQFTDAAAEFGAAQQRFEKAEGQLRGVESILTDIARLLPETRAALQTADAVLTVGQSVSQAGQYVTAGLAALEADDQTVVAKLAGLRQQLELAVPEVRAAAVALEDIDSTQIPDEYQVRFIELQQKVPALVENFENFIQVAAFVEQVLGERELKRYLVLFQNNHEIRATGGFIGSYALIDIVDGEIVNIEVPGGGSYDLQGALSVAVAAPQPLQLINPRWEFQDSNWFPDYPTAAEKMLWFYEEAGGPTVDGIITLNAELLVDLLNVIGPVGVDDKQVSAETFFAVTQRQVEIEYDKEENRPKAFIGKMVPTVLERVLSADKDDLLDIIDIAANAMPRKQIQLYFTDPTVQQYVADFGWENRILQTEGDYLMVVNSNIAGQKTDAVIDQQIYHHAFVQDDGRVIVTVRAIRQHNGVPGELFYGARNVNYMRFYVPQGSRLISADGFQKPEGALFADASEYQPDTDLLRISGTVQTDETGLDVSAEFGKTVFGGWTQVYPGKRMVTTVVYELPFRLSLQRWSGAQQWVSTVGEFLRVTPPATNRYSLVTQKQSGTNSEFHSLVEFPETWQVLWQHPQQANLQPGQFIYQRQLETDGVYSLLFAQ